MSSSVQPARPAVRRRIRLLDVARAAGVSTMTVTRVLHAPEKVADGTRTRVQKALRVMGYTPDLMARGLVSNRSGLVAAIVPVLTNSLIAEIVQGLTDALSPEFHLLLGASGFSAESEESLVRTFLSRRIDAIFLSGVTHTARTRRMLRESGIVVVEGGNLTRRPIDMLVGYSNVQAAAAVTRHLVAIGRKNIGYIGAVPRDNDRARDRRDGYEAALRESGRASDPSLCIETTLDIPAGAEAMSALLAKRRKVDAVFCSADALAVGALFECQRRGIRVPAQVALAGFDDLAVAAQVVPALTTLRVPRYVIGQRAGELIRARLSGQRVDQRIVDTGFEFVQRETA